MIIAGIDMAVKNNSRIDEKAAKKRGMVLPFQPLSLAFNHVNYYVDMPAVRNIHRVLSTDTVMLKFITHHPVVCLSGNEGPRN